MPLIGVTDGPLFGTKPGVLSSLANMELWPGGYAEARGGMEKLKPSGGTAADAIATGGHADAIQLCSSFGWIRTATAAGAFSANKSLHPGGWLPFDSGAVNDAVYFGADAPFSRVGFLVYRAAVWTVTLAYEYWNGSAWTALTTAETTDFTSVPTPPHFIVLSYTLPSNWATTTIGDGTTGRINKYWVRIRIATSTVITTLPMVVRAFGTWVGHREVYVANHDPKTAGASAVLRRQGQNATTTEWFSVGTGLYSGASSPARLAGYRGRVYMVNGKEQKRWDGNAFENLGLAKPGAGATAVVGVGAGLGAGVWRVYIAFGYGPVQFIENVAHPFQWIPMYGWSQATYISEVTTTAPNGQVIVDWSGLTIGSTVSVLGIYMTRDLTNVDTNQRANMPAFLWESYERYEMTAFTATPIGSISTTEISPPLEAILYDNKPPSRAKHIAVYQNRLFIGDDEYWYWSEPFQPDVYQTAFNFMALARAEGGRHMGAIEFADQLVLFTEDQTWGLTNIDNDIPYLYPIAPGVGCVAPDSIAVGDGHLMWLARDGVYSWDGDPKGPKKVSNNNNQTFGNMGQETHGGSKATIHRRRYDVRISNPDYSIVGNAYRFSFDSGQWSDITHASIASALFPLCTIHAPLGNNDAGGVHPLWGKVDYGTGAGEYGLFLGELTTQDNGTNYTCSATMHFPLPADDLFRPKRALAYYQAANGWGTPSLAWSAVARIGSDPGTMNTGTPDPGDDYTIIGGTTSGVGPTSDLKVTFTVNSAASGTVNRQRFFGAVLEGTQVGIRRGAV